MRGRIVLFIVLAVAIALVGVYVGWSTNTPKAIGEPSTPIPSDSVGSPKPPTGQPPTGQPPTGQPPAGHPPTGQPPTGHPPTPSAEVRFGRVVVTEPSDDTQDLAVSSDNETLTVRFSDREADTQTEVSTRSFAMTMPLTDGAKGKTLRVYVQGYAFVDEGASARLTLRLNGLVKVRNFTAGSDDEFVQTLELPAIPATTYQLEGVVEVQQDPGSDGVAHLSASAIDSSFS
jgi:hypothetical protein